MTDAELAGLLREHALLEGDFVLRSGRRSSYYLDKYRFETRPDLLKELGERIATRVARVGPGRAASRRARARCRRARGVGFARRKPPLPHRPQGGEGVRDRAAHRGGVRGRRRGLSRRGRGHERGRRGAGGRGPQGGRARLPDSGLRGRSGGGRGRRARPQSGAPRADFYGLGHPAGLKRPANPHGCVLSGVAVRVLAVSQAMNVDGRRGQ